MHVQHAGHIAVTAWKRSLEAREVITSSHGHGHGHGDAPAGSSGILTMLTMLTILLNLSITYYSLRTYYGGMSADNTPWG